MQLRLTIFFVVMPLVCVAQREPDIAKKSRGTHLSLQSTYLQGYVFGTNAFLRGNNAAVDPINSFQAFSLKLSMQTTGHNLWEQLYNYPSWGLGLYAANFDNRSELGIPFAFYGFFNAPFERWPRLSFNYELGLGAAFNWRSFSPVSNPFNTAIGGGASFFIDAGLMLQYGFLNHFELQAGMYLTHFSNGALKKPNDGVNTIAPALSVKYNFYDPPDLIKRKVPVYKKENEWLISFFSGVKNVVFDSVDVNVQEKYEGIDFPVLGIATTLNRQISRKSKIGIGLTVAYNGSVNAQAAVDENELDAVDRPLPEKIQLSIYPSYELLINRISIILQPALYIYRTESKNQSPRFYQRVGVNYHFTDRFFAGLTLRDYDFHKSDFIEWTIGYRIKWK